MVCGIGVKSEMEYFKPDDDWFIFYQAITSIVKKEGIKTEFPFIWKKKFNWKTHTFNSNLILIITKSATATATTDTLTHRSKSIDE